MSQLNVDVRLNVIVTGDQMVGKTSLIRQYVDQKFTDSYIGTVGVDFTVKKTSLPVRNGNGDHILNVLYKLYDIGGQNQYVTRIKTWAPQASAFLICYDITNYQTFVDIHYWYKVIVETMHELSHQKQIALPYNIILIGNKADLSPNLSDRSALNHVTVDELRAMCCQLGVDYAIETSAKTGENVTLMFDTVSRIAFNNHIRLNCQILTNDGANETDLSPKYKARYGYLPILYPITF